MSMALPPPLRPMLVIGGSRKVTILKQVNILRDDTTPRPSNLAHMCPLVKIDTCRPYSELTRKRAMIYETIITSTESKKLHGTTRHVACLLALCKATAAWASHDCGKTVVQAD